MNILISLCLVCCFSIPSSARIFPSTKGEPWPMPQNISRGSAIMNFTLNQFNFEIIGKKCHILDEALSRYTKLIKLHGPQGNNSSESPSENVLKSLQVDLKADCEDIPSLEMNEYYNLTVAPSSKVSTLTSDSIWGILRGLETFSQLIYFNDTIKRDLYINETYIQDFPRFPHRGLLLDTGRHFISTSNILKLLDGMEYNKMNVFHWSITNSESFPYESITFPLLSKMGAFHPTMVYTQTDVRNVIEYATLRGIRVIAEFDIPAHADSWGKAYPQLLTPCYGWADYKEPLDIAAFDALDPTEEMTYTFLENIFKEISQVFPDLSLHLGGDEIYASCWYKSPRIKNFMKQNNMTEWKEVVQHFFKRAFRMIDNLKKHSIIWQEVYLQGAAIPNTTSVQIWDKDMSSLLNIITDHGKTVILSTCWYLDHLKNGGDWQDFYQCDPHDFPGSSKQKKLVLGGEACMWSETVDNNNVLSRVFPRASATAEKLWSAHEVNDAKKAAPRLEEHYCRMNRRGYPAQPPNGAGFCV